MILRTQMDVPCTKCGETFAYPTDSMGVHSGLVAPVGWCLACQEKAAQARPHLAHTRDYGILASIRNALRNKSRRE